MRWKSGVGYPISESCSTTYNIGNNERCSCRPTKQFCSNNSNKGCMHDGWSESVFIMCSKCNLFRHHLLPPSSSTTPLYCVCTFLWWDCNSASRRDDVGNCGWCSGTVKFSEPSKVHRQHQNGAVAVRLQPIFNP